jgi:hypothetical protein
MSQPLRAACVLALALGATACGNRPTENSTTVAGSMMSGPAHHQATLSENDVQELRRATDRFHRLDEALSGGYAIFGGCFSDSVQGGMGQHYANNALIADSAISLKSPELLLYESDGDGRPHLVGVEYIVFVDEWHAKGNTAPPRLFNTDFHVNPTLLAKPFYLLHAWVWKRNPSGTLADWNPRVRCP